MFDNFISSLKNGFKVADATRKLVFADKELFLYPVVAAIIGIAVALVIISGGVMLYASGHLKGLSDGQYFLLAIVFFFVIYFFVLIFATYFTISMLIAFREYAKTKKKMRFGDAIRSAWAYRTLILEWALFYSVVVTIIRLVEGAIRSALSRYGIGGNIISGLITGGTNLAFAAAVAFSLPVILDEKKGPIDTIKSSTSFIMKNFGDTFGGLVFAEIFQIVLTLAGLGIIILGILPFFLVHGAAPGGAVLAFSVIFVSIGILVIVFANLLRYVLFNCFKLIVYDYKTRGTLPKGFDKGLIDSSVKRKKNGGSGKIGISTLGLGQPGDI